MAVFTSVYKPLAHGAPNWDTQLRTDMGTLETILQQDPWAPSYGGGSGATVGSGGGSNGYAARLGRMSFYTGRILFGSSSVFGGGVISGFNVYGTTDQSLFQGDGTFRMQGGGWTAVRLIATSTSDLTVLVASTGAALNSLGTPAASSELNFRAWAVSTS